MRKVLSFLSCFFTVMCCAQSDSTAPRGAVLWGMGSAVGFYLTNPDQPLGYNTLLTENKVYEQFKIDLTVLWKERIGLRIQTGRIGRVADASAYKDYITENFEGYQYLPDYSNLAGGFTYTYFCPQFAYKKGSEPFNVLLCGGIGFGKLNLPRGVAEVQHIGSNDHKEINYLPNDPWNVHAEVTAEFGYMRQLSQHWFLNAGIYLNGIFINSKYSYTYGEQDYGQPVSVFVTTNVKYVTIAANAGVFLNFQWNKRESARAIYE